MSVRRLSWFLYASYAAGSVGTGGFGTVPGLLLLYYLTNTLGVSPVLAGAVVFAPKAWDIVLNPYVGQMSDRSVAKRGTRGPFLLAGALTLPVFFLAMFFPSPSWSPHASALWVAVTFLLAATAFSVFQVPYIALPAEITDSYEERTSLMSYRITLLAIAILLFGAGAPALVQALGGGLRGYRWMAVTAALVICAGLLSAWAGVRRARPILLASAAEGSLLDQLRVAQRSRMFLVLLGAYMAQALATGCMLAGAPYVATYVLDDPHATTVLFASLITPAIVVMPLWTWLSRRWGKKTGWLVASGLFGTSAACLCAASALPRTVVLALVGACGVGYAGMQLFPLAMLPDAIQLYEHRAGEKRAGVFTGLWTAGETVSLALGPAAYSTVLALTGFASSRAGEKVAQTALAVHGVVLGFGAVPAVFLWLSLLLVRKYAISADDLAAARRSG